MRETFSGGLARGVGALLAVSLGLLAASSAARAGQEQPYLDDLLATVGQDDAATPLAALPAGTREQLEAALRGEQRPSELVAGLERSQAVASQAVALDARGLVEAFAELKLRVEALRHLFKRATVEERLLLAEHYQDIRAESALLWQRADELARELGVAAPDGGAALAKGSCSDLDECDDCEGGTDPDLAEIISDAGCYLDCVDDALDCAGDYAGNIAAAAAAATTAEFNRIKGEFDSALTDLEAILTDIGTIAASVTTDLGTWVEDTFTVLLDGFEDTAIGVLDSLAALPGEMDLDVDEWWDPIVSTWRPIDVAPACPEIGEDLGARGSRFGIGVVGDASTEWACRRSIDWYAEIAADLAPDDIFSLPANVPATLAYYPINYFCLCLEAQSAASFDDAQAEHRAEQTDFIANLLHPRLDRDVHLVATQSSVDALNAELDDLQVDTDALDLRADVLLVTANDLHALQDEQDEALALLGALSIRVSIEENLIVAGPPDVMDVLVRPASEGGYLEEVRATVEDTIRMNQNAAQDIHDALRELDDANAAFAAGDHAAAFDGYRRAYREAVRN
jgi:hypothetical protein